MNTKKTLVAVIAAMLVAATLPCFAKGNVVTQWKCIAPDGSGAILTFYSDKTCEMDIIDKDGDVAFHLPLTYSGDTTKNGKISIDGGPFDGTIVEIVGNVLEMKEDDTSDVFVKVKK